MWPRLDQLSAWASTPGKDMSHQICMHPADHLRTRFRCNSAIFWFCLTGKDPLISKCWNKPLLLWRVRASHSLFPVFRLNPRKYLRVWIHRDQHLLSSWNGNECWLENLKRLIKQLPRLDLLQLETTARNLAVAPTPCKSTSCTFKLHIWHFIRCRLHWLNIFCGNWKACFFSDFKSSFLGRRCLELLLKAGVCFDLFEERFELLFSYGY